MVISSGGALSGRTTRGGCGSKVIDHGVPPRSAAPRCTRSMILQVAAVQAVEVAEREHRLRQPRRPRVVGEVDDVSMSAPTSTRNVEHEAIIGQLHAGGQARAGRGVRQVVAMCVK